MKQYKNTIQTIQNTVNTSAHITKTPTQFQITGIPLYWGEAAEDHAEHSLHSAGKLRDNWSYTSIPAYAYMM